MVTATTLSLLRGLQSSGGEILVPSVHVRLRPSRPFRLSVFVARRGRRQHGVWATLRPSCPSAFVHVRRPFMSVPSVSFVYVRPLRPVFRPRPSRSSRPQTKNLKKYDRNVPRLTFPILSMSTLKLVASSEPVQKACLLWCYHTSRSEFLSRVCSNHSNVTSKSEN